MGWPPPPPAWHVSRGLHHAPHRPLRAPAQKCLRGRGSLMAGCLSKCLIMSDCFRISRPFRCVMVIRRSSNVMKVPFLFILLSTEPLRWAHFGSMSFTQITCSIATDQLKEAAILQFNTRDLSTLYLFFGPTRCYFLKSFIFKVPA